MKDLKRPYSHNAEWRGWERARAEMKAFCIEAAPLSFGDEDEAISHVQQVLHIEERAIGIQYEQPRENEPHIRRGGGRRIHITKVNVGRWTPLLT